MGTLPRSGTVEVTTATPPEQVWDLLADITRAGEWSHETRGGTWLDGATTARAGARFRGFNGKGRSRWTRTCEVLAAGRPGRLQWRTVPTRVYRDSTRWTVEISTVDGVTHVSQHFEVLRLGPILDRLFYALIPAHRDRTEALRGDLERLVELAATARGLSGRAPAPSSGSRT